MALALKYNKIIWCAQRYSKTPNRITYSLYPSYFVSHYKYFATLELQPPMVYIAEINIDELEEYLPPIVGSHLDYIMTLILALIPHLPEFDPHTYTHVALVDKSTVDEDLRLEFYRMLIGKPSIYTTYGGFVYQIPQDPKISSVRIVNLTEFLRQFRYIDEANYIYEELIGHDQTLTIKDFSENMYLRDSQFILKLLRVFKYLPILEPLFHTRPPDGLTFGTLRDYYSYSVQNDQIDRTIVPGMALSQPFLDFSSLLLQRTRPLMTRPIPYEIASLVEMIPYEPVIINRSYPEDAFVVIFEGEKVLCLPYKTWNQLITFTLDGHLYQRDPQFWASVYELRGTDIVPTLKVAQFSS